MHQGQICRIERNGLALPGWYQKLISASGSVNYYKLNSTEEDTMRVIQAGSVDDSMHNQFANREYKVTFVLPPDAQVTNTSITLDYDYERKVRADIFSSNVQDMIDKLENRISELSQELDAAHSQLTELKSVFDGIEYTEDPGFTYVYGRHTPNTRELCWRVPFDLVDKAVVGAIAMVETAQGNAEIRITRVMKNPTLLSHKLVVEIVE